ncbi:MAG TPA: NAD(P)H-dependent glycerol-3-phosphate dehydrogenase [bacterium]|nr:NAD(P)H-dependent glycerol-3-phosphate dehydrogenase [bacterium]
MSVRVGVLGAGGWGTALAMLLAGNGHAVRLWEYNAEAAARLARTRENPFLPGIPIPETVRVTADLQETVKDAEIILLTVPSHTVRSVAGLLAGLGLPDALIVSGTKGIENHTLKRVSQILTEMIPDLPAGRIAALSGPSHAEEVARGIPTAVTAASTVSAASRRVQEIFMNDRFRVYSSRDPVGVELGGALKNVIAVAAGISDGAGCGDNTKAALMTRGIVEITRLGTAMGAEAETFAGLSGIGDLIVTCTSRHSRNRFVGEEVGKGRPLNEVLDGMLMVAEGVRTTQSALDLSKIHRVDMPITREVYHVLFERKPARRAIEDLMTREAKAEDRGV